MQRRSTPHLVEAREKFVKQGALGKVGLVEIYCYYAMRARENPPDTQPPANLDYEMWTGPAPMRPYNKLCHPRGWRAFMEYCNGIVGDMCIHMFDMVRWMLDLGWPKTVSSTGGIYVQKESKANISDTQSATFDYGDLQVVWQHRMWGDMPSGFAYDLKASSGTGNYPRYPWGATIYGDRGTLEASVMGYTFTPKGSGEPVHKDVVYELDQFPEDKTEKDLEKHVAPAIRAHWKNFLECRQNKTKPVSDIEQGHISTVSCILANQSMAAGRALRWDPERGTIAGDPDAEKLMRRPYRGPWVHPEPGVV
jgi:predicted dehydrogenase